MNTENTQWKEGDVARTPFEPSGLVRILEIEPEGEIYGVTARVEYVEDHPHGYRKGSIGRYKLDELRRPDSPPEVIPVYCFRAECQRDVNKLLRRLSAMFYKVIITHSPPEFPDVDVEIEVKLSLEELREFMRKVPDGHVMEQTVASRDEYTGKRNYSLGPN